MELPRVRRAQSKPAASPRHLERAAGVGFVRGDGGTLFADATAWESLVVGDDALARARKPIRRFYKDQNRLIGELVKRGSGYRRARADEAAVEAAADAADDDDDDAGADDDGAAAVRLAIRASYLVVPPESAAYCAARPSGGDAPRGRHCATRPQ